MVTFIPMITAAYSTTGIPGQIATVIDYDDANAPASFDELRQYTNYKTVSLLKRHSRILVPAMALAAYNGTFSGYASKKYQWLDSASPNIQHYGLKIGIQNCTLPTNTLLYDVEIKVNVEFKNIR